MIEGIQNRLKTIKKDWIGFNQLESGCIVCSSHSATNSKGYSQIRIGGKTQYLHRVIAKLFHGESNLMVMHTCDNRLCCNPEHLKYGTALDNSLDMMQKNRRPIILGSNHGASKLSEDIVSLCRASNKSDSSLAREFNVSVNTMRLARTNQTWKHIGDNNATIS